MRTHHGREATSGSLRHYLYVANTETGLTETSLRQRLKRETTAVHQHLEAQLGLLYPGLDVHRYLRVLEAFYGFYVPVEAAVRRRAAPWNRGSGFRCALAPSSSSGIFWRSGSLPRISPLSRSPALQRPT
jgi:Heme oxygenase